jgi:hypothetical protein
MSNQNFYFLTFLLYTRLKVVFLKLINNYILFYGGKWWLTRELLRPFLWLALRKYDDSEDI